jgi:hypothetical protein
MRLPRGYGVWLGWLKEGPGGSAASTHLSGQVGRGSSQCCCRAGQVKGLRTYRSDDVSEVRDIRIDPRVSTDLSSNAMDPRALDMTSSSI